MQTVKKNGKTVCNISSDMPISFIDKIKNIGSLNVSHDSITKTIKFSNKNNTHIVCERIESKQKKITIVDESVSLNNSYVGALIKIM